jgi:hypothetical protein
MITNFRFHKMPEIWRAQRLSTSQEDVWSVELVMWETFQGLFVERRKLTILSNILNTGFWNSGKKLRKHLTTTGRHLLVYCLCTCSCLWPSPTPRGRIMATNLTCCLLWAYRSAGSGPRFCRVTPFTHGATSASTAKHTFRIPHSTKVSHNLKQIVVLPRWWCDHSTSLCKIPLF